MPDIEEHPLAAYSQAYNQSCGALVIEQLRLEGLGDDDSMSEAERSMARAAALEITSAIGQLDAANTAFLVKVFTGEMAPSEDVVKETVRMNKALAKVL